MNHILSNTAHTLIKKFGFIIKKNILFIPTKNIPFPQAVKSMDGFWYCGNVYDMADIAYGISINGLAEKEETFLVQKILKQLPKDYVFLDIGANTGYYGIMSAFLYPESKTFSFEPIKNHYDSIRESAYLN